MISQVWGPFFVGGGGGSELLAQKTLESYPNCYETVEEKQGSYDKLTLACMWNKYFLHMNLSNEPKNTLKETAVSAMSTAEDINDTIHCWLQSWHMPFYC